MSNEIKRLQTNARMSQVVIANGYVHLAGQVPDNANVSITEQASNILERIDTLLASGHTVMIETSGERDISGIDPRVVRIVDFKCPGSGECERNRWGNLEHLTPRDELKFVVSDRRDYEWAREVIRTHRLSERVNAVLLSPVFGRLEPSDLAAWLLADRLAVRMQLQMHKHIWSPTARGV